MNIFIRLYEEIFTNNNNPKSDPLSFIENQVQFIWEAITNISSYEDRIQKSKRVDPRLIARIQQVVPWRLEIASVYEDKNLKIDIKISETKDGKPVEPKTVQMKRREQGGDDVLVEMILPFPPAAIDWNTTPPRLDWTGRDMKGNFDWYFHVNSMGVLRIFNASELKPIALKMANDFLISLKKSARMFREKTYKEGEIKIVRDESNEANYALRSKYRQDEPIYKMVAFITPDKTGIRPIFDPIKLPLY